MPSSGIPKSFPDRQVTIGGITHSVAEWCEIHRVGIQTVYRRASRGVSGSALFESVASAKKRQRLWHRFA